MDQDLHDLLLAWNGGDVVEPRRTELLARLRQDATFRAAFAAELQMLGMLKAAQTAEPRWLRLEDELGAAPSEPWNEEEFSRSVMDQIAEPKVTPFPRKHQWPVAAALVVFTGVAALWLGTHIPHGSASREANSAAHSAGAKKAPALAIVSRLGQPGSADAHGIAVHEGDVVSAGKFRVATGGATLRFFDGAVLFVDGAADLDLVDVDRVLCRRGRLRVRMEEGTSGFTVTGPGMAVVDLGTEFALNVSADGHTALRVFEGQVEASVLNREGYTLRSELLQKDESAAIQPNAGRIARTEEPANAFAPAQKIETPSLALDPSYAATVLSAKPWGYWRFESFAEGATPNEIPGGPALRASSNPVLSSEPGGNHTMLFPADTAGQQYLLMDGAWQQPARPGYAMELWLMPAAIRESALVSLIDATEPSAVEKHYFLLQMMDFSQRWQHPNGALRFLHRFPPSTGGGVNAFSDRAYLPGVWQHVVAQNSGDMMELYMNGQLVGHAPVDADQAPGLYRLLVGRLKRASQTRIGAMRPFVGNIDELAFYEHTLSPQEIARHYALVVSTNSPSPK